MASKTPTPRRPTNSRASAKSPVRKSPAAGSGSAGQNFLKALERFYVALSHLVGGAVRAFGSSKLAPEDRRDGAPFFLFLISLSGALFAWFLIQEPWARWLHDFSFGMLFGLTAYGLPVVFFGYAIHLFRNPATVRDGSRFGLGFWLFLSVVSGFFHVFTTSPSPQQGPEALAAAGGLFGWLFAGPLLGVLTVWGAVPALVVIALVALLVMTGTSPNKIAQRLRELYGYLFGDRAKPVESDAFDGKKSSWWQKADSQEPAFDTAVVDIDEFVSEELANETLPVPDVIPVEEPEADEVPAL